MCKPTFRLHLNPAAPPETGRFLSKDVIPLQPEGRAPGCIGPACATNMGGGFVTGTALPKLASGPGGSTSRLEKAGTGMQKSPRVFRAQALRFSGTKCRAFDFYMR